VRESPTLARLSRELRELESRNQLRRLDLVPGTDLSSNDYLGLARDPRLQEALARALAGNPPAGSTGSRLLSGNSAAWMNLEEEFARFAGTEGALLFTSGYAANIGLLSSLLRPGDTVFSDAANHASIIDGIRLSKARRTIFPHLDLDYLEDALRRARDEGERFIVVESVFSMEGDRAPLEALAELAERYGADLMVDEAHSTGVFGPEGRGLVAAAGLERRVLAVVHTCGKALASAGAFVCGSEKLKHFLINRARTFIFSTALPPCFAAQISAAARLARAAETERRQVAENSAYFRSRLREAGFEIGRTTTQIVPLMLGENETALAFAAELQRRGFAARAIRPPSVPAGTARLRLSLTATLDREVLDRLVAALLAAREQIANAAGTPSR
jgi:8-amino-7-oxononanoate synthase